MYFAKVIIQSDNGTVIKQASCEFSGHQLADIRRGIRIASNLLIEDEFSLPAAGAYNSKGEPC